LVRETMERENLKATACASRWWRGCSGFQYSLDLDEKSRPGDLEFDIKGLRCFVDPMSSMYLMGVEVDYVEQEFGQSGSPSRTPTPSTRAACGSSFSPRRQPPAGAIPAGHRQPPRDHQTGRHTCEPH